MTNEEYVYAIKKLNPEALFVIWNDKKLEVKWDDNHKGKKPTYDECLEVLEEVKFEIEEKNKQNEDNKFITMADLKKLKLI